MTEQMKYALDKKLDGKVGQLINLEITRPLDESFIYIKLQSDILETFMRQRCSYPTFVNNPDSQECDKSSHQGWKGLKGYILKDNAILGGANIWGESFYIKGAGPNMAMIRARGLTDGLVFKFPAEAFSTKELSNFQNEFKNNVVRLYGQYIKPINMKIKIITEQEVI